MCLKCLVEKTALDGREASGLLFASPAPKIFWAWGGLQGNSTRILMT